MFRTAALNDSGPETTILDWEYQWGTVRSGVWTVRRRTSTYVHVRRRTSTYVHVRRRTSTYVDVRRRTSMYVAIRRRTSTNDFLIFFGHRRYKFHIVLFLYLFLYSMRLNKGPLEDGLFGRLTMPPYTRLQEYPSPTTHVSLLRLVDGAHRPNASFSSCA